MPIFYIKGVDGKYEPVDSEIPKIEGEYKVFRNRKGEVVRKIGIEEQYWMENPEEKKSDK